MKKHLVKSIFALTLLVFSMSYQLQAKAIKTANVPKQDDMMLCDLPNQHSDLELHLEMNLQLDTYLG
ncbi:hypothetical protein [Neobacillus sp. LXY-1]|uniref:hypothetical protein n=1 Tax=Neobacillus sp. LXY-1 TaxID=3379133 RepID=UPI003EE0CB74